MKSQVAMFNIFNNSKCVIVLILRQTSIMSLRSRESPVQEPYSYPPNLENCYWQILIIGLVISLFHLKKNKLE